MRIPKNHSKHSKSKNNVIEFQSIFNDANNFKPNPEEELVVNYDITQLPIEQKDIETGEPQLINFYEQSDESQGEKEPIDNNKLQLHIEMINKEFQEDSDYQEIKIDESDNDPLSKNASNNEESNNAQTDREAEFGIKSDNCDDDNQSLVYDKAPPIDSFSKPIEKFTTNKVQDQIITLSENNDAIEQTFYERQEDHNIQQNVDEKQYTNIQTDAEIETKDKKKSSSKKKRKHRKILVADKSRKNNKHVDCPSFKFNFSFERPKLIIKNAEHQKEIEAKLEKGIVNHNINSIFSTGLTLQSKLIDEKKLMELLNDSAEENHNSELSRSSYQTLICKLKENPEILMQVIPTNRKKILQNNLIQNKEMYK